VIALPDATAQRVRATERYSCPIRYLIALLLSISQLGARSVYGGAAVSESVSEPTGQPVDWRTMLPSVRRALKDEFVDIEQDYPIHVLETADITGDGVPEAVVNVGVVGASSDWVTLMRLDGGRPRVARFRDWKGKVFTLVFPEGASATHGQNVELLPAQHAIAFSTYSRDSEETVAACCDSVFKWNAKARTFDWDGTLSKARVRAHRMRRSTLQVGAVRKCSIRCN